MSVSRPTSFCPRCNKQVLLARKQFNTCLGLVLLLFTVIGFFIYLAVYYSKKGDRCVHCGTQITFSQSKVQFQPTTKNNIIEEIPESPYNFCPLCREDLEVGLKFCPNCGSKVT